MWQAILSRLLAVERKLEQVLAQIAAILTRLAADEQLLNQIAAQAGQSGGSGGGGIVALADSGAGMATGSRSSPTSATVTILVASSGGPGLTSSGGSTVTAYNLSSTTAVGASKTVEIIYVLGAWYVVQVLDC
jgi:hypothetical protein